MGKMKLRPQKPLAGHRKDAEFIVGMHKAGKLAGRLLAYLCSIAKAGMTTLELDQIAYDFTLSNGGTNACLGYRGYPNSICTSVNEVLCHGVPDNTPLKAGDILNIDVTVKVGPYHGDTSRTIFIAPCPDAEAHKLVTAAYLCQIAGMKAVRPMGRTGDIGFATQERLRIHHPEFFLIKDIGGHGIGKIFHDKPHIPAMGVYGTGDIIRPWTCITVEPIVADAPGHIVEAIPGSEIQVFRGKGRLAAQFEHTLLITDTGYEILTEG
jgi:methionyl aminopeptidase